MKTKIKLPPKKGENEVEIEFDQLVIIGANGAGKTRFGSWIEMNNYEHVHRISAQKSLSMPFAVRSNSIDIAQDDLIYGTHNENRDWLKRQGKKSNRWNNNLNTSLLNDYDQLMVLLHSEEYEKSLLYKDEGGDKPITKLDRIQSIFESVFPHRKVFKRAGVIEVYPTGQKESKYNGSEMSDGERCIFYLTGEVLCAPSNSIIIIDEPEMHIHTSLINHFFDLLEAERPDCPFVYLTHNIDFAFSRQNAKKIWAKSYEDGVWDYELLSGRSPIPEQLYLEILGSRQPVIFIEGDNSSIDYEIYSQVFSSYTIKYVNSCNKVIQITKSFNDARGFHHIESYGIIDRDRRDDTDINNLVSKNIWVLDVAEAENLLLLEDIVKAVASHMGKEADKVFNIVKQNLITFFSQEIDSQVLLHFREVLSRKYRDIINFNSHTIEDVINEIDASYAGVDKQSIFDSIKKDFQAIVKNNDYYGVLRVFNLKNALVPRSKLCEEIGVRNKDELRSLVISLMKIDDKISYTIKSAIKNSIIMQPI